LLMKRLKENEEGKKLFICPFCGAPQRGIIPQGTVQVNCQYCGALILVPPWMGGERLRCTNHPERLAVGICNDCGRSFCAECLRVYHLEARDAETTLYLDTACLRKRYAEKAGKTIWAGILFLAYGIFAAMISLGIGILVIIFAGGMIAYSVFKRRKIPTEPTFDKVLKERERIATDSALKEGVDAEKLYNELLTQYVQKWGALTGTQLLREEIRGYLRLGVDFPEAVRRIHTRSRI
jgi:DNA-directed RNA polymerase subunit RPC12/RpoP